MSHSRAVIEALVDESDEVTVTMSTGELRVGFMIVGRALDSYTETITVLFTEGALGLGIDMFTEFFLIMIFAAAIASEVAATLSYANDLGTSVVIDVRGKEIGVPPGVAIEVSVGVD